MLLKQIAIRGRLLRFHEYARYMTHLTQIVYFIKNSRLFAAITLTTKNDNKSRKSCARLRDDLLERCDLARESNSERELAQG